MGPIKIGHKFQKIVLTQKPMLVILFGQECTFGVTNCVQCNVNQVRNNNMNESKYTIVLLGGQVQDKIGQADGGRQHCDD